MCLRYPELLLGQLSKAMNFLAAWMHNYEDAKRAPLQDK